MHYKALITDLDGTALPKGSDGSDIEQSLVDAMQRVTRSGIRIACATGRAWHLVQPVVKKLGLVDPCIVEGGTRIVDPISGNTLWSQPIVDESVQIILDIFRVHNESGTLVYSDEFAPMAFDSFVTSGVEQASFLYLLGLPEGAALTLARELNDMRADFVAYITPSWRGAGFYDVHVTHRLADKGHAVNQWCSIVGVTAEQTIGIGDSGNDLPMFQAVGLRVAVANATVELKAASDHIAPSQSDGALEYVLQRYFS